MRDRQADYYTVLGRCDKAGDSTELVEFLLEAILSALLGLPKTEQVIEHVGGLLNAIGAREMSASELMQALKGCSE